MKSHLTPGQYGRVLALLTLLFFFRVLGQALVVFFSVGWLPSNEQWASGLLPYPALLAIQVVMLVGMVKILSDVWREGGFFAMARLPGRVSSSVSAPFTRAAWRPATYWP